MRESNVEDGRAPLARLVPGRANNRWIRPAWDDALRRDPEAGFAADPSLGTCPAHLAGKAILRDIDVTPVLEADEKLSALGDPVVDLEAGTATRIYAVVSLSAGELAARLAAAETQRTTEINAARDARLAAGCRVTFPDGAGALTFKFDRALIHNRDLLDQASAMVAAGDGDTTFPTPYRDEENVNHAVTAQQLADITTAAHGWYTATWLYASERKDLVLAAETLVAATVAPATGWPDNDLTH